VLLNKQIHRVNDIGAIKLKPFFTKTHIQVPAAAEKEYIQKFVIKTIPKYEVKIEGIEMFEKQPVKQAILVLEEDFYQCLCLSLYFRYDDRRFEASTLIKRKKIVGVEERNRLETIVWFERDLAWEEHCAAYLNEIGLKKLNDYRFYLPDQSEFLQKYGLIGWMNRHLHELNDFQIEQKTAHDYYNGSVIFQSKVDEKIDWFEMNIEVVLDDGLKIPFSLFRKHILNGNPEFLLPDGRVFILPEDWFSRYQEVMLHSEADESILRLRKIHGHLLDETAESLQLADNVLNKFRKTTTLPAIPAGLESVLRPYQKQGFYWLHHLYELHFGACLADDMGLGKTLQTITLLESIYVKPTEEKSVESNVEPGQLSLFDQWNPTAKTILPASLVVAPTSLLHNWKNELRKFAPNMKVYLHEGIKRLKSKEIGKIFKHYHIIITSYGIVRSDLDYLKNYDFFYLILDESQTIKNPESISYQSVKQLNVTHRIALTGTPIENSLNDLWAQFNFINPGLLGSFSSFKTNYINKITKENDAEAEKLLLKLIHPFLLRRTKEEVTPDLPPLLQEIVYCDMTEAQESVYEKEKNNIRNHLLENRELYTQNKLVALQSLMRLRLLANHPVLNIPSYTGDSGKFNQILLYFESIRESHHKVLIFSSFVKHLNLLAQVFDQNGWKYAWLTGQTNDREAEIDRFNHQADVQCFFISLKAGGVGLNLTAADYVFIIDPWWNPAAEMQALSRAHRIGQDKSVMVYRFLSTQTIEEKILHLQAAKQKLSDTFVASNNPLGDLDSNGIISLLDA
jgi:SNF2 family DNA or RNA helicase